MENNKIKETYDQIHTPENLKERTYEKMKDSKPKSNFNFSYLLAIAAVVIFALVAGTAFYNDPSMPNNIALKNESTDNTITEDTKKVIAIETNTPDLLHFKTVKEVRDFFDENYEEQRLYFDDAISVTTTVKEEVDEISSASMAKTAAATGNAEDLNYSKTNTQVENVDEADFVKTDGEYIYYVTNNTVYIVKADGLKMESKLEFNFDEDEEKVRNYYPGELFITEDKLIVIGNYIEYSNDRTNLIISYRSSSINTTKAYIYDIKDKENPEEIRQIDIDGDYDTSRLIGSALYLISTKYMYYTPDMKDDDILPIYYDSNSSSTDEYKKLDCKNIIYCEGAKETTYKSVGVLNIDSDEEIAVESFLGYTSTVYCSENNLYLTSNLYNTENKEALDGTEIYKFNISDGGLKFVCKNSIDGYVNNQFSLDEYNGNLRVATTVTVELEPNKYTSGEKYTTVEIGKTTTNNILYVLDENLKEIGKLTDFGMDEKIYSVRFMGTVAYIVTFEQIDPLFVIDLSDPKNPIMKGELEIPGYSSYLHPYDENHVIGIGYNVKNNGNGRITNETLKISMFDVSDLSNPKEVFSKTLGEGYSYSNVTYDHKLLMYDKQRDLIGFPISMNNEDGKFENAIMILKIDLENSEFSIHSKYTADNFNYYMRKVIYIEDTLYLLCDSQILAFDINTLDLISNLKLPYKNNNYVYFNEIEDLVERE